MSQSNPWHSGNRLAKSPGFGIRLLAALAGSLSILFFAGLNPSRSIFSQEQKHSDPSRSCVSGECHGPIMKHKYLHGPLKIGQCTVCHAPSPGTDHKFILVETEAKLCLMCHKSVDTKGYMLHDPVAKGKCLGCHEPHGSEEPYQVSKSPQVKMCNECHDPVATRKYAHKPVGDGDCLSCHRPHGNKAKNLLDATGSRLCLEQCHEKMRTGKAQKMHLASEDCTQCHRSHDSNYPALLTRSPLELCMDGCHKEIKENMASSTFKHDPMTKDLACVECHRAHDNKFGNLLRKSPTNLCSDCHEKWRSQLEAEKFKHRPVADKSCLSCHTPHDSIYRKLLFTDYPSETSSAYAPEKYAFCFSCHSEKITRERYTTADTDFRNGRLNLHYVHVNKESGGKTCRACHSDHASSQPKLIRAKEQFGNWTMMLQFKKSDTGGSCLAGCHQEYSYDRIHPKQLSTQ